jgi:hypothetical protein
MWGADSLAYRPTWEEQGNCTSLENTEVKIRCSHGERPNMAPRLSEMSIAQYACKKKL